MYLQTLVFFPSNNNILSLLTLAFEAFLRTLKLWRFYQVADILGVNLIKKARNCNRRDDCYVRFHSRSKWVNKGNTYMYKHVSKFKYHKRNRFIYPTLTCVCHCLVIQSPRLLVILILFNCTVQVIRCRRHSASNRVCGLDRVYTLPVSKVAVMGLWSYSWLFTHHHFYILLKA